MQQSGRLIEVEHEPLFAVSSDKHGEDGSGCLIAAPDFARPVTDRKSCWLHGFPVHVNFSILGIIE